jgi:uncharacterized protein
MTLEGFFEENNRVALGFSGGVDSSYLLYAGLHYGADVRPYYIKTALQPQFEFEDAKKLAANLGVNLTVIELDALSIPAVAANPIDRCYHCKTALFGVLKAWAISDGFPVLIDGTNASDDAGDRPGMRALKELSVRSPLRECGLTKDEIRRLSKEAGLFTWDKPAYACLATRVPSDTPLTEELLSRVEGAESVLFIMGFTDFRVRVFYDAARLQFPKEQMERAVVERQAISESLRPFFETVLLDLKGILKGLQEGGATVSEKHANFIVNDRKGTASDVRRLMDRVRATVLEASGVDLLPEIVFVGDWAGWPWPATEDRA